MSKAINRMSLPGVGSPALYRVPGTQEERAGSGGHRGRTNEGKGCGTREKDIANSEEAKWGIARIKAKCAKGGRNPIGGSEEWFGD